MSSEHRKNTNHLLSVVALDKKKNIECESEESEYCQKISPMRTTIPRQKT